MGTTPEGSIEPTCGWKMLLWVEDKMLLWVNQWQGSQSSRPPGRTPTTNYYYLDICILLEQCDQPSMNGDSIPSAVLGHTSYQYQPLRMETDELLHTVIACIMTGHEYFATLRTEGHHFSAFHNFVIFLFLLLQTILDLLLFSY